MTALSLPVWIYCQALKRLRQRAFSTTPGSLNPAISRSAVILSAAGVSPDDVDTVLLTHCHPDHIGGLLDAEQRPIFQHAELHLQPLEAQYWRDDEKRKFAGERGQRNFALARQTLDAYAQNLRFLAGTR